ncbi:MAG: mannose-1-phosphate guanylyltransferase, partial [Burkholderiales bacterium]
MLIPVILSGGAGTRLWPVSREAYPKPFMRLGGERSLLQRTVQRAAAVAAPDAPIGIVTNREYVFKTADEVQAALPQGGASRVTQLLEPVGRNTAPAVALAALWVRSVGGPEATLLVLPADHLVQRVDDFVRDVRQAETLAAAGHLVTFGIRPTQPETGFGYIELGDALEGGHRVRRFVEKPELARALEFLQSGRFLWNSGMFLFRVDVLLAAFERHAPEVLHAAQAVWRDVRQRNGRFEFDSDRFAALPDISIDYAVMEHAAGDAKGGVGVVEASFDWSDIGSWKA